MNRGRQLQRAAPSAAGPQGRRRTPLRRRGHLIAPPSFGLWQCPGPNRHHLQPAGGEPADQADAATPCCVNRRIEALNAVTDTGYS